MAKVLLINLNHCLVTQDLLFHLVREEKADLVIISEEYRDLSVPNCVRDSTGTAAIWVCGDLPVSNKMSDFLPGFTCVEVAGIRIYNCYLPPSHSIVEFRGSLDVIVASARSSRLPVVIRGGLQFLGD